MFTMGPLYSEFELYILQFGGLFGMFTGVVWLLAEGLVREVVTSWYQRRLRRQRHIPATEAETQATAWYSTHRVWLDPVPVLLVLLAVPALCAVVPSMMLPASAFATGPGSPMVTNDTLMMIGWGALCFFGLIALRRLACGLYALYKAVRGSHHVGVV